MPVQADQVQPMNDLQEKLSFWTGKKNSFKMRAKIEQVRAMAQVLIKNKIVNETMKAQILLQELERDLHRKNSWQFITGSGKIVLMLEFIHVQN